MRVINARNAHEALPMALQLLRLSGVKRDSRNGPVIVMPEPVTIVYAKPCERVIFWPERDANPFFHLAEALWMVAGRDDVEFPARYAKQIASYSDDGEKLHGAYGYRWRSHFGIDQLAWIAQQLKKNPDDRRCVLGIWDPRVDLMRNGKDLPCNTIATLSRDATGALDLTMFQRSGDVIWGVLGANAVHMSIMQEYLALMIGCPVGRYTQVVSNFHAYVDKFKELDSIRPDRANYVDNPYVDGRVFHTPIEGSILLVDNAIDDLLYSADHEINPKIRTTPFFQNAWALLAAHQAWRIEQGDAKYAVPLEILSHRPQGNDWIVAATEWLQRRQDKWNRRFIMAGDENTL